MRSDSPEGEWVSRDRDSPERERVSRDLRGKGGGNAITEILLESPDGWRSRCRVFDRVRRGTGADRPDGTGPVDLAILASYRILYI